MKQTSAPLIVGLFLGTAALAEAGPSPHAEGDPGFSFRVERLDNNPIIHRDLPGLEGEVGRNINGPSLVAAPPWLEKPLGRYYLYFGHHHGKFIRLATADELAGPWTVHAPGVLPQAETPGYEGRRGDHVASPDVHIDEELRRVRMYFHQPTPSGGPHGQGTYLALADDGLNFTAQLNYLGLFYFRVFSREGWHYALAKYHNDGGILYRSRDGVTDFEAGPRILPRVRHTAVWQHDGEVYVFHSRGGDEPEHILCSRIVNLDDDWTEWKFSQPVSVITPEKDYEGASEPIRPSQFSAIHDFVHELRDPAIYEEDGRVYLLYSTGGETAIAIAEIHLEQKPTGAPAPRNLGAPAKPLQMHTLSTPTPLGPSPRAVIATAKPAKDTATPRSRRPNIVLAFADDLGRYASAYRRAGVRSVNDHIQTPATDRIAAEGALFWNAFVSVPSCTPSRAALISGRHFFRNGSHSQLHFPWNGDRTEDPWNDVRGFGLMLADVGYHIGWSYKMHISEDRMGGPEHNYERAGAKFKQFSQNVSQAADIATGKAELLDEVRQNFGDFLADRKDDDQPFFYSFNPTNTHRAWEQGSGQALWGVNPDLLRGLLPGGLPDEPEIREDFADYLGEVMAFDAGVEVLLVELEQRGMLDHTLVIISGDHGAPGFPRAKANLYDFGTQVPLVMRLPGQIEAGRQIEPPVSLLDLAPTILHAAGLKPTPDMNGQNLLPILVHGGDESKLRGWAITGRETHVNVAREGKLPYPQRALRTRDHLYIINFKPDRWPVATPPLQRPEIERRRMDLDFGPTRDWFTAREGDPGIAEFWRLGFAQRPEEELYDVAKDPDQVRNLAGLSAYAAIQNELRAQLLSELRANDDPRLNNDAFDRPPYNPHQSPPSAAGPAPLPDTSDAGRGLDLSALTLTPLYEADFHQPLRWVKEADLFEGGQRLAPPHEAEWILEGPASAETRDGRLHLVNAGGHLVCWNTHVFPADLLLEFDVIPADASQGLGIVFFAATGRDGGGIFDQNQPYRDGIFPTYHSGGLDSYHVSYWANRPTGGARETAHIRKNHGFHLVSQGRDFISGTGPGPHRVRLLKLGGRIEVEVNGKLSVGWTDNGQTHGPVLQGGRIGLRQMAHTKSCGYTHFKVWSVTPKQAHRAL